MTQPSAEPTAASESRETEKHRKGSRRADPARAGWLDRVPYGLFVPAASLLACLVTLYFFCPRYYVWRGVDLGIPELWSFPEVNRAVLVLEQLNDPFVKNDNPSNRVIMWRLLFPLVGHYLHFSKTFFLSLTFFGCWAAAAMILHVLCRESFSRAAALLGTLSSCATAWFFVSTAWLTYNDSWIILALMTAAAVRSRWALGLSCLLAPWIDERFLIALPSALALRTYFFSSRERPVREFVIDLVVASLSSAPYALVRLVAYFTDTDPVTKVYAEENFGTTSYPLSRYLEGTWAGLRCNWFYVLVWAWLSWKFVEKWWAAVSVLGVALSLVVIHLLIPGDLHRSAAVFAPAAVAGMVLLQRVNVERSRQLLLLVTLLNFALPASQVITVFKIPIYGFFDEWNHWNDPQHAKDPRLTPQPYVMMGVQLAQAKRFDESLAMFDRAIKIAPQDVAARVYKSQVYIGLNRIDDAISELNAAIAANSDVPDSYWLRGQCREQKRDFAGAASDYGRVLKIAPQDWKDRKQAEANYKRLRDGGIFPSP